MEKGYSGVYSVVVVVVVGGELGKRAKGARVM